MVDVETEPADDDPMLPLGRPARFTWTRRGRRPRTYRVRAVLEAWATTREWWRDVDLPYEVPLDVWHYRVEASSGQGQGSDIVTRCGPSTVAVDWLGCLARAVFGWRGLSRHGQLFRMAL